MISFGIWVKGQTTREDAIGAFAKDYVGGKRGGATRKSTMKSLMIASASPESFAAANEAWDEYERVLKAATPHAHHTAKA